MNTLQDILNRCVLEKENKTPSTHTRITGGKWDMTAEENAFYNALYEHTIVNGKQEYFTEKQVENGSFAIDLDFRYKNEVSKRQHTKETLDDFQALFLDQIQKYSVIENAFKLYVMEKPNVNQLSDGSLTKDGIHLLFTFAMNKDHKNLIRNAVIQESSGIFDLPLINTWEDVYDKGVMLGTTNWNIYGCCKPDNEAYKVVRIYDYNIDPADGNLMVDIIDNPKITKEMYMDLSVRKQRPFTKPNKDALKELTKLQLPEKTHSPRSVADMYIPSETDATLNDTDYLLQVCIRDEMCKTGKHKEWNIVAQILKNELKDEALSPFVMWTNQFGSENKKKECIDQIVKYVKYTPVKEKNRLNFKSLHYYAKKYNPEAYNSRFTIKQDMSTFADIDDLLLEATDYSLATYFVKRYGEKFKCISIKDKLIYHFTDKNLWCDEFGSGSKIRELISNEMNTQFCNYRDQLVSFQTKLNNSTDEYEKIERKIKKASEIIVKLGKTNDKNNILREILDKIEDVKFEDNMNKQLYMLPLKNKKMLEMKTTIEIDVETKKEKITNTNKVIDRTTEHKFNYECDTDYIENMTEDDEKDVKKYFMDLFCGKEKMVQVMLDIFKSIFAGQPLRYIFFFTGSGCNGKSLLFKVLDEIFKKAMDTIDTNVIIDQKIASQLTTQFKKLDRCRFGYVTELKEEMKLNESIIKKISGGDKIDFRGLFKDNVTIVPTCTLGVLTNEMPQIKIEKAIVDRLVRIPFGNVFKNDKTFEAEILSKKHLVFSYIMKYGVIRDNFDFPEEMINAKNETIEDNTQIDYLKEFIDTNLELVEFKETERMKRDDFRASYNNYLKSKNQPQNNYTHQKFARIIKTYGIGIQESNGKCFYTGIIPKVQDAIEE
jgi:P4 family phage/plasmid primase-like protien